MIRNSSAYWLWMPPYPEYLRSIFFMAFAFVSCQIHFSDTQGIAHRTSSLHTPESQTQTRKVLAQSRLQVQTPGADVTLSLCFSIYKGGLSVLYGTPMWFDYRTLGKFYFWINTRRWQTHIKDNTSIFTQLIGSVCFPQHVSIVVTWEEPGRDC